MVYAPPAPSVGSKSKRASRTSWPAVPGAVSIRRRTMVRRGSVSTTRRPPVTQRAWFWTPSVSPGRGRRSQPRQDRRSRKKGEKGTEWAYDGYHTPRPQHPDSVMALRAHVGRLLVHQLASEFAVDAVKVAECVRGPGADTRTTQLVRAALRSRPT